MAPDIQKWIKKNLITRYINTNCPERRKCYEILEMILDGESSEKDQVDYHEHINQCWNCFQDYKLEKAIRDLIKYKIEKKPVPVKLLSTIKERLSESTE